jgi:two-component system sensor histidine kinase ArlS
MARIIKKLLPGTLRIYIVFALCIMLIGAPAFYFVTRYLYINDTNEALQLSKNSFMKYVLPGLGVKDIAPFNRVSWNVKIIEPEKEITSDIYQNRPYADSLENEEEIYRVLLSPVKIENNPYTLLVRMNMIESQNLAESILIVFAFIIIFLVAGLIIITKEISGKLWKPFYNSLDQIEAFQIDKSNLPHWQETGIEEFARLNAAMDTLIERNLAIYKSQKEFIENAAHELQTPLASFKVKLDTLMQVPALSKEQAGIVEDLIIAANKLIKLNKNLLLLSKLQRTGQLPSTENISLAETLKKHIDFYSVQAKAKNIRLNAKIESEMNITANLPLFESMLGNLILNAVSHNTENGTIIIGLKENLLSISNTGKPDQLNTDNIFKNSHSPGTSFTGNGLGLAIASRIADLYHWKLSYILREGMHCFEVIF